MRSGKAESYCLIEDMTPEDGSSAVGARFILDDTQAKFGDYLGLGLKWNADEMRFDNLYNNLIEVHCCQEIEIAEGNLYSESGMNVSPGTASKECYFTFSTHQHFGTEIGLNPGKAVYIQIFRTRDNFQIKQNFTAGAEHPTCTIMLRRIG